MDNGLISCGIPFLFCLLFSFIFIIFKGKAAILISGFNTLPKAERELYDKDRMSRDHRNIFLTGAAVFGAGTVLSYFISQRIAAAAAWIICGIIFFKNVHLDEEKAFGKYKK